MNDGFAVSRKKSKNRVDGGFHDYKARSNYIFDADPRVRERFG